jgi:hypothetical protein
MLASLSEIMGFGVDRGIDLGQASKRRGDLL